MKTFSGSHTRKNIAKEIQSFNTIVALWNTDQGKIHLLVYDNGATIVKGVRMSVVSSIRSKDL